MIVAAAAACFGAAFFARDQHCASEEEKAVAVAAAVAVAVRRRPFLGGDYSKKKSLYEKDRGDTKKIGPRDKLFSLRALQGHVSL